MTLPTQYAWLNLEPGPRLLTEMLKLYGTVEAPGTKSNPKIVAWAEKIGLGHVYKSDAVAWCGLTVAYAAAQAGWDHAPLGNALWARNWAAWGTPQKIAMLGDVLVFARGRGGHVAIYIGENAKYYFVLGGNQGDAVTIKMIAKSRCIAIRRCPWRVNRPANIRRVFLKTNGTLSTNEA